MLIEWIRVCFRQGWLGKDGRHVKAEQTKYQDVFESFRRRRTRLRLAPVPQHHAGNARQGTRHRQPSRSPQRSQPAPVGLPSTPPQRF